MELKKEGKNQTVIDGEGIRIKEFENELDIIRKCNFAGAHRKLISIIKKKKFYFIRNVKRVLDDNKCFLVNLWNKW